MPAAVLFDLDDTILDDSSAIERCWTDACLAHRAEYAPLDPDLVYRTIREKSEWFWSDPERHRAGRLDMDAARAHVVRLALDHLGIELPALAESLAAAYSQQRDALMEPLPEAIDTVRWFRSQGSKLALVTNGAAEAQRRKIVRFQLAGLFDSILIEGELGFGKPDERIYRRALRDLSVEPGNAWMVGDNFEFDVAAPGRLGLFTIWIDRRGTGLPPDKLAAPGLIVRALSELRSVNMPHSVKQ